MINKNLSFIFEIFSVVVGLDRTVNEVPLKIGDEVVWVSDDSGPVIGVVRRIDWQDLEHPKVDVEFVSICLPLNWFSVALLLTSFLVFSCLLNIFIILTYDWSYSCSSETLHVIS